MTAACLVLGSGGGAALAAFSGIASNAGNSFSAAPDWTAPAISPFTVGDTAGGAPGHVRQNAGYEAFAQVSDSGNPSAGISSVTADLGLLTSGQSSASLSAGSHSFDGTSYNRKSSSLTAGSSLPACTYPYSVTATDGASNSTTVNGKATVDRDLLSDYNVRLDGAGTGGDAGYSAAGAGDVNADGKKDAIVGALNAQYQQRQTSGAAYVIFGKSSTSSVDLDNLGGDGFRIEGAAGSDLAGVDVAGAGDVNQDGKDDVLVGAHAADNNNRSASGSVYLVFGKTDGTAVELSALGSQGYRIDGAAAGESLGQGVDNAGDVNGDGRPDAVVGGSTADNNGRTNSGSSYVVFGQSGTSNIDLASLGTGGYRIDGQAANDESGLQVAGAGDVNNDGRPDVLVGAARADNNARTDSGSAYVVFGKTDSGTIDLASLGTAGYRIDGALASDFAGWAVDGIGELNGDGRADLIVAARLADNNGRSSSGSTYVVFGQSGTSNVDLAALGTGGYRIDGESANDESAYSVSNTGDVNGDLLPDLVLGARNADHNLNNSGSAYVVFGKTTTTNIDLASLGAGGYRIDGPDITDAAGFSVAGTGDADGDGRPDVLVGARFADSPNRVHSGSAFLTFGKTTTSTIDLASLGTGGYRIEGASTSVDFGYSVAGAGDVNGDGRADALVGTRLSDGGNGVDSGGAYVVFGQSSPTTIDVASLGTRGYRILGVTTSEHTGQAVANAGDVNGDGRADAIIGAWNSDLSGRTDAGTSFVVFGKADNATIDLSNLGTGGYRIYGEAAGDQAGYSVAGAGDVNGDTIPDQLIGARQADPQGRTTAGASYVVFGKSSSTTIDMASLGAQGYKIEGEVAGDELGYSIDGAGDVNGDSRPDALIGARLADNNGRSGSGSAYVVFGKADTTTIDLAGAGGWGYRIDGAVANDNAGISVAGLGDVNGDGAREALVGAHVADFNGTNSGSAYVLWGKSSTSNIDLNSLGSGGYRIDGGAGDQLGIDVGSAGDANGDGRADALVGAQFGDPNGRSNAGGAFLVFGKTSTSTVNTRNPGDAAYALDGVASQDQAGSATSVDGAGDVNGDGRPDLLVGARYADLNGRADSGAAYIVTSAPCSPYAQSVFGTPNLVSYWRLGEPSWAGTTARDYQGSNNGTYTGGVSHGQASLLTSDNDKAAGFDGVDDYVQVADSASLDLTDAITVEAWLKPSSVSDKLVAAKRQTNPNVSYSWEFGIATTGQAIARVNSNSNEARAPGTLQTGTDYHLVMTYDRTNIKLYVNGQLEATRAYTAAIVTNDVPITIGRRLHTGGEASFPGDLDEVAIYNRALSGPEIQAHFNAR